MKHLNFAIFLFFTAGMAVGAFVCMFLLRLLNWQIINANLFYLGALVLFLVVSVCGLYHLGRHRKEVIMKGFKDLIQRIGID